MSETKLIRIAIDGPAAAGKSTVAKKLAQKLSFVYIDTGAMYRAFTLHCLQHHVDVFNAEAVVEMLSSANIELRQGEAGQLVLLNGEDVTEEIRQNKVSRNVSHIAKIPEVREEMVQKQRALANNINVIMDGRDIGTNVIPEAEVKIYLIASVEERAKRRYEENIQKGIPTDLEKLKEEIAERDQIDMNRKHAPLKRAEDAIAIDTTSLTIDDVIIKILQEVEKIR